jgi:hypothetical protein
MAEGLGPLGANAALDAVNAAFPWIKLHTGAPGAAGTSNAAGNTTRKQVADTAAASGASTNTADLTWTSGQVTTTENYTHYSRWSASTAGNFGYSGAISGGNVTAGTAFTIPAGDLDGSFTLAS